MQQTSSFVFRDFKLHFLLTVVSSHVPHPMIRCIGYYLIGLPTFSGLSPKHQSYIFNCLNTVFHVASVVMIGTFIWVTVLCDYCRPALSLFIGMGHARIADGINSIGTFSWHSQIIYVRVMLFRQLTEHDLTSCKCLTWVFFCEVDRKGYSWPWPLFFLHAWYLLSFFLLFSIFILWPRSL